MNPENTSPDFLDDAISRHPDTIFILGHLGYDFINKSIGELETCLELAKSYPTFRHSPATATGPFAVRLLLVLRLS